MSKTFSSSGCTCPITMFLSMLAAVTQWSLVMINLNHQTFHDVEIRFHHMHGACMRRYPGYVDSWTSRDKHQTSHFGLRFSSWRATSLEKCSCRLVSAVQITEHCLAFEEVLRTLVQHFTGCGQHFCSANVRHFCHINVWGWCPLPKCLAGRTWPVYHINVIWGQLSPWWSSKHSLKLQQHCCAVLIWYLNRSAALQQALKGEMALHKPYKFIQSSLEIKSVWAVNCYAINCMLGQNIIRGVA